MRKGSFKYRRVNIKENRPINLSLTYTGKENGEDKFNVFNERTGHNIGEFLRHRLDNFSDTQLNYVKKHGTTNFTIAGVWK